MQEESNEFGLVQSLLFETRRRIRSWRNTGKFLASQMSPYNILHPVVYRYFLATCKSMFGISFKFERIHSFLMICWLCGDSTENVTLFCLKSKCLVSGGKVVCFLTLVSRWTLLGPRLVGLCCGMAFSEVGSSG